MCFVALRQDLSLISLFSTVLLGGERLVLHSLRISLLPGQLARSVNTLVSAQDLVA